MVAQETQIVDLQRPIRQLETSLADVEELLSFHEKADSPKPGKPSKDHSTLKRSAVVLIYAAWESFFENLIDEVVNALSAQAEITRLPVKLQSMLLSDLRSLIVGKRASEAGDSETLRAVVNYDWSARLRVLATEEIYGTSGDTSDENTHGINSADVKSVRRLLQKYCGGDLLGKVAWAGMSNNQVTAKLDKIVQLRGSVAHTGRLPDDFILKLALVREYVVFVRRLAAKLVAQVDEFVIDLSSASAQ